MALIEYDYTKQIDLPSLTLQIQGSTIVTALDHIDTVGTAASIFFKATLSDADKTTLDGIVAAHTGIPSPNTVPESVIISNSLPAFSAKTLTINGVVKNLFKRFTGMSQVVAAGSNTFTWTQANYPWIKFVGIEVIGGEVGDNCDLFILDTATGTYSGHANYQLNQFGYTANIAPSFYRHVSDYDADIYQNLQMKFVYNSVSAKTVYINFDMNEVK